MNYPVWEVPGIGTPWVIGCIAIFHVMISHFAVGGGCYLAIAMRKALKENRRDWLPLLHSHSKFFLLITGVFGTVSGVGIWFAIGLVNPGATSALIHNFVFGWAIEWLFFLVEVSSIVVFYYAWGRISDKLHLQVAYLYAVSSILTLVIINGILTFMLTPGHTWLEHASDRNLPAYFWYAFFNPTYFPSLFMRMLAMMSLAGVWALVSYSRLEQSATRDQLIRWSVTWLIPAFLLMPVVFFWYQHQIPASNWHLTQLGMATIGAGTFTQITRIALLSIMATSTIAAIAYFFAYKSPKDFTTGHALSLLFIALMATASTEYAREAIRKPFVIGSYMYSNGVRVKDVAAYRTDGYIAHSAWAPSVSSKGVKYEEGRFLFRGECMSCHTINGYRSMKHLLGDRDDKAIGNILTMLKENKPDSPYHAFMPPLATSDEETDALKYYLLSLNHKLPKNPNAPIPTPETAKSAVKVAHS
ncbi:MAG: cytochrome ubiquinol oxidase subunit I [Capsulimonadaceae bacterium]|nr:cytochrome ubiquinol oxidase subunit I [Capsulimonadaceae bacterium]